MRLSPFFDAERFAAQFGTQEARDHLLEGLTKGRFSLIFTRRNLLFRRRSHC